MPQIFAQKIQMGTNESFISSVTLEWAATWINFASELPLFTNKIDPKTDNIIRDYQTIEELKQRPLDWSRQSILTQYLIIQKAHKFSPILAVISPQWVDDNYSQEWDLQGKAKLSAYNFTPLNNSERIGTLDLPESLSIFALDGQHRLMGIQGLIELINTGQIHRYSKDKKPLGSPLTINDLIAAYNLEPNYLETLKQETIGIELIPAVIEGETHTQAKRRIRSIFVHVNLMAMPLSKGQVALLNEDNGFSIVARQIAVTHPFLREEEDRSIRVEWDKTNITNKSRVVTTLQALQDMAEAYLSPIFNWKSKQKGLLPLRPNDEELTAGIAKFRELFDYLSQLPSYQKIDQGMDTISLRHFSHEKFPGEGNFLFRPVGQIALAQALGILGQQKGFKLKIIYEKLAQFDHKNGFSNIDYPQSFWYGIIYDPNKRRILVSGRDLAVRLLVYLLDGMQDKMEQAQLKEAIAFSRTIEDRAINFQGIFVKPREIELPSIL